MLTWNGASGLWKEACLNLDSFLAREVAAALEAGSGGRWAAGARLVAPLRELTKKNRATAAVVHSVFGKVVAHLQKERRVSSDRLEKRIQLDESLPDDPALSGSYIVAVSIDMDAGGARPASGAAGGHQAATCIDDP